MFSCFPALSLSPSFRLRGQHSFFRGIAFQKKKGSL
jgi:hypothetical protein